MPDVFQFFSGSADAPAPGKGAGETLESPPETYKDLKAIKGWRKILSNFGETPFEWKGLRWKTLEHAFHAAKFETIDPAIFRNFSMDSGSALGQGDGAAARAQRKAIVLNAQQKAAWDARRPQVQKELWQAKFTQDPLAQRVLLATGNAQLWHQMPRSPKEHWTDLEEIRSEILEAQRNQPDQPEMADAGAGPKPAKAAAAKPKGRPAKKAAAAPAPAPPPPAQEDALEAGGAPADLNWNVGMVPEGALAAGVGPGGPAAALPPGPPEGLDEPDKRGSAIRFCPVCRYYLYLQLNLEEDGASQKLFRLCRNCGYKEDDEKGGLVMESILQERSSEGYKILLNEFTRRDPRLPHIRKGIKCPDPACASNHGQDPDVIYIKYDAVNLLYLYICNVCGFQWKSRR